MHIKISRSAIADALNNTQSVVASKASLNILQNVKIDAREGKATFTCTDLDVTLVYRTECEVIEDGTTTLPVKLLASAVGKVVDGLIDIDVGADNKAKIKAGSTVFRINGLDAKDFPILPSVSGESVTIAIDIFRDLLRKTAFAMSLDETRRSLQGVFFDIQKGGKVVSVATDGRRLAVMEGKAETPDTFAKALILPKKTVEVLSKRLPKDGNAVLTLAGSQLQIECTAMTVVTKLIDETYPNYKAVIPTSTSNKVVIDRTSFLGAIDRVSVFATVSNTYSIRIKVANNLVELSYEGVEYGDGHDEIPVKYDEKPLEATYNPQYLRDVLSVMDEDEIELHFNDGDSPAIIRKVDDSSFTYVLMPLRTV